jgi:hypothetical protein
MSHEMTDKDFIGMTDEEISEAMTDGEYFSDMPDEVNNKMPDKDWFGQQVDDIIRLAESGDTAAAKKLMQWYCGGLKTTVVKKGVSQRVNREPSIDERILRYFGECFEQILGGVAVERAMSLEKDANRPPDPTLEARDIDIAFGVDKRVNAKVTKRDLKKSKEIIYNEIGLDLKKPLGYEAVKKIVGKHKTLVKDVNAVDLPSILEELDAELEPKKKR